MNIYFTKKRSIGQKVDYFCLEGVQMIKIRNRAAMV